MLSPSSSQLLLRLKIKPLIVPTDILVLLCPFTFLIPRGQKLAMRFPGSSTFLAVRQQEEIMSWKSGLGFCLGFFFLCSSNVCDLDSVNGKALNKEQKFYLQFMHSQKSKICSVMLPYNFSGSQKGDPRTSFGWKHKVGDGLGEKKRSSNCRVNTEASLVAQEVISKSLRHSMQTSSCGTCLAANLSCGEQEKCLRPKLFLVSVKLENWSEDVPGSLCRANDWTLQHHKSCELSSHLQSVH